MKTRAFSCSSAAAQAAGIRSRMKINVWSGLLALICCATLQAAAAAVIYEPFADSNATLTGNTPGLGLSGTWLGSGTVTAGTLDWGSLPAGSGNKASFNNQNGYVSVGTTLSSLGLLDDGAVLWFSVIVRTGSDIATNGDLGFALGTDQIGTGNNIPIANGGQALGVRFKNNQLRAAFWAPTLAISAGASIGNNTLCCVVGKFIWGATSDTVEIYNVATDLTLTLSSTYTTPSNVNQSLFDTVSIGSKAADPQHLFDEIRFGARLSDVIGVAPTPAYWDIDGSTAGAGGTSPSETWSAANLFWNNTADGTGATNVWTAGEEAVFAAGTDATGSYTVTVDGTQDIGGLVFEEGNVTLTGGTSLRLVNNYASIGVASSLTGTVASVISDDGSARPLLKYQSGTLVLSGNNTYTGVTTVDAGALVLSGDNSAANGGMTINAGAAQFDSTLAIPGSGPSVTVNVSGAAMFGPSFGAGNIQTTLANRIVAASIGAIAADNYATTDFDFSAAGLTAASLGAVGTVSYTGTYTPNGSTTIRLGGGGGTLILNSVLPTTKTLEVKGPGIVQLNGFDTTLPSLTSVGSGAILENGNATTPITVTINNSGTSTCSASLRDGTGSQPLTLVKTNAGTLTLTGSNTHTGGTIVNGGNLTASADANLGVAGGGVTFNTSSTFTVGSVTYANRPLTINNDAVVSFNSGNCVWSGNVTGNGSVATIGSFGSQQTLSGTANTFEGQVRIAGAGVTGQAYRFAFGSLADSATANGRIVFSVSAVSHGNGSVFEYAGSTDLVLNNRQIEIASTGATPTLGHQIRNNGTSGAKLTINTDLIVSSTTPQVVSLGGSTTGTNLFAGKIVNGSSAMVSLRKVDACAWTLSGANTFSGPTTNNAGTLVLAAGTCLSDTTSLTINTGAKLQLNAGVKEKVGSLFFGATLKDPGIYGSTASEAPPANQDDTYFSGTGLLYAGVDLPAPGTIILLK